MQHWNHCGRNHIWFKIHWYVGLRFYLVFFLVFQMKEIYSNEMQILLLHNNMFKEKSCQKQDNRYLERQLFYFNIIILCTICSDNQHHVIPLRSS